jgi:hypothetical protein
LQLILHEHEQKLRRMVSSGLLRRVPLVRTDVLEEPGASETSVLTRATRHNNPEDTILHSHRRENLKSHKNLALYSILLSPQKKIIFS